MPNRKRPPCTGLCHEALLFAAVGMGVLTLAGVALLIMGACFPK